MDAYYDAELEVEREHPRMRYREILAEGAAPRGARARASRCRTAASTRSASAGPRCRSSTTSARRSSRCATRGWSLAILTNCDDDLIATTVARMPVEFDLLVTAEQVGSYKPAHGHWHRFTELTAGQRDAWVHAANSWVIDIKPASELRHPARVGRPRSQRSRRCDRGRRPARPARAAGRGG